MPDGGIITGILIQVAIAAFSAYAVYVLTPRPKQLVQGANDLLRTSRGSILPWRVIYGQARVGGALVFQIDSAGNYAWQVIVVACHEVDEIVELWANDVEVTLGSWTAMTDTNGYADGTGAWAGKVRIYRHHGSASQVASPELNTAVGIWGSDHRLRGRAYFVLRLNPNASAWPNGLPNWSVVVKGKKVYDPRTDTTIWSENPALCIADYLFAPDYGLAAGTISGSAYTEIDDATLVASANECEEAVDILPSGTEDRYTLNGAFDVDAPHEDILARMLTSMAGTLVYAEGKWFVHAGAHTASVQSITEDDLVAPVRVTARLSRSELFNRVKGIYVSPANKHLPSDYPIRANSTYATEDGELLTLDHDLPFTNSASMAQRLANIELETCRQQITVELKCKLTCLQLRPPDRCTLTLSRFGWSSKLFRVTEAGIEHEQEGGAPVLVVALTLRETATTIYDWDETTQETEVDPAPDTTLDDPLAIDAPTNLVLDDFQQEMYDGQKQTFCTVEWDGVTDPKFSHYEVRYKFSILGWHSSGWKTAVALASPVTIGPLPDGATATVEVQAVAVNGPRSSWLSDTIDTPDAMRFRPVVRGQQSGTAQDGASITFAPAFSSVPTVHLIPKCKVFDSGTLTGSQKLRLEAQGLTTAGFTLIAKVAELASSLSGQSSDAFSGTDAIKQQVAEAVDDKYTFQYDVSLNAATEKPSGAIIETFVNLSFWTRPNAGSWTQRATANFSNNDIGSGVTFTNQLKQVTVNGLGEDAEFRILIDASRGLTGGNITRDPVTWTAATPGNEITATPQADTVVDWIAYETAA